MSLGGRPSSSASSSPSSSSIGSRGGLYLSVPPFGPWKRLTVVIWTVMTLP